MLLVAVIKLMLDGLIGISIVMGTLIGLGVTYLAITGQLAIGKMIESAYDSLGKIPYVGYALATAAVLGGSRIN